MRRAMAFLASVAVAASPFAAAAQQPASGDLTCAAWAAMLGGSLEDEEQDAAAGLQMMLVFELGRYRGETGKDADGAEVAARIAEIFDDVEQVEAECLRQMEQTFARIAEMGQEMQAAAAQMPD